MKQIEKHIGIISVIPVYIFSVLLSRFLPDILAISLFIICFVMLIALRSQYFKRKKIIYLIYFLLIFCSIHFFAFCLMKIPDGEAYDSPSDENSAEGVAMMLSIPLSFVFSLVAGILFDFWKNKNFKFDLNGSSE